MKRYSFFSLLLLLALSACKTESLSTTKQADTIQPAPSVTENINQLRLTQWTQLIGWEADELLPAWNTFMQSCTTLKRQPNWQAVCTKASMLEQANEQTIRLFFESQLAPYQVFNSDGSDTGIITGYYEPLLQGSKKSTEKYRFPIYSPPDDLLVIDLGNALPDFKNLQLRGRLEGRKVVPFYSRAEIEKGIPTLKNRELLWVDDRVALFFLHIQGSGRIQLENGEIIKVGYADQNGHPYVSIGSLLVQRGELPLEKASMQGIKQWGVQNPEKLTELLHQNSRYVFFRLLPDSLTGPLGSLGVPLTAGRSLAIDPRVIPQGAPVFLSTTWPNSDKLLNRLMVAQDTGSAIKGGVRADFFWGFGKEAENQAGKMKQNGKMWVLLPKDMTIPPHSK